jgi:Zn-dependent protease with chaperone function
MIGLGIPLLVAVAAAVAGALAHRRARPAVAAVTLTIATVATAIGAVTLLVLYAIAFTVDPDRMAMCRWLVGHHEPHDATVGVVLTLLLAFAALRGWTFWRARQRTLRSAMPVLHADERRGFPVSIVDTDTHLAYAHPGDGGRVIISRGLLRVLSREQRLVVVAHERAHLAHRHHRYLLAVDLVSAALPPLRPLARAVRLHTERWADEDTARTLGGDRRLVAATIAHVALAGHPAAHPGPRGARRRGW